MTHSKKRNQKFVWTTCRFDEIRLVCHVNKKNHIVYEVIVWKNDGDTENVKATIYMSYNELNTILTEMLKILS